MFYSWNDAAPGSASTNFTARSILAESILNLRGKGQFRGYSAGSRPNGTVNPYALAL
jgi:arsenate reductase